MSSWVSNKNQAQGKNYRIACIRIRLSRDWPSLLHYGSTLPASKLGDFYQAAPKILKSIVVAKKIPLKDMPNTRSLIEQETKALKNMGRIMLRYSGTENKLRILVEAHTDARCQQIAKDPVSKAFYEQAAYLIICEQEFKMLLLSC